MFVYFAGVEGARFMADAYAAGHRYFLMSYLYLKRQGAMLLQERVSKYPEAHFMIDSGAHTFLGSTGKQDFDRYVSEYVEWLCVNRSFYDSAVELDIGAVVGLEKVWKWREDHFFPLRKDGMDVIFVYHEGDPREDFARLCQRSNYVGLPYAEIGEKSGGIDGYFTTARKTKTRLHGFGMTSLVALNRPRLPWTSLDSTTWKAGEMYGSTFFFDGHRLNRYDLRNKQVRKRLFVKARAAGLDWKKIEQEDCAEVTRMNAIGWTQFARKLEKALPGKRYWQNDPCKPTYTQSPSLNEHTFSAISRNLPSADQTTPKTQLVPVQETNVPLLVFLTEDRVRQMDHSALLDYAAKLGVPLPTEVTAEDGVLRGYLIQCGEVLRGDLAAIASWKDVPPEEFVVLLGGNPGKTLEENIGILQSLLRKGPVSAAAIEPKKRGAKIGNTNALKHGLYSERRPAYHCDVCPNTATCPEFKPGYVCAYVPDFSRLDLKTFDEALHYLRDNIRVRSERAQMALVLERLDGGYPDPAVTGELQALSETASLLAKLLEVPPPPPPTPTQNVLLQLFGTAAQVQPVSVPVEVVKSQEETGKLLPEEERIPVRSLLERIQEARTMDEE